MEVGSLEKLLLTVNDVASVLSLGRTRAYQLVHSGELPIIRVGRSIRVSAQALKDWTEAHNQEGVKTM